MASGHVNRIQRPNTWLHRPMPQNVKKALANPEPSTHGTFKTCQRALRMSASGGISEVPFQRPLPFCPKAVPHVVHTRFHSITSSARSKTDDGSVRPIACAAFRLAMSWNLVCCRKGRSAGFAPANMSAI